jgi:hypothetical protein
MRRIIASSVPVWLCHIFPHYIMKGTMFGRVGGGMLLNIKSVSLFFVLIFSTMFVSNMSISEEMSEI